MTNSKFTPGPWFAKGRYIGTKNHMSYIGECRDVNGNWSDDAKSSGDAQLIAAAPTLLEALLEARTQISLLQSMRGIVDTGHGTLSIIDAALAKAGVKVEMEDAGQ